MWRYRWLVIAIAAAAIGLGVLYNSRQVETWTAEASLVVEDPQARAIFETATGGKPERYVENQVGVLRSAVVAQQAAELSATATPPADLEPEAFEEQVSIRADRDSDLIVVLFDAEDPDVAVTGANALIEAYQEVRRTEAANGFAAAIAQLDSSIASTTSELLEIQTSIGNLSAANPAIARLQADYEAALEELARLQQLGSAADPADRNALTFQLDSLAKVLQIEAQRPEVGPLLQQRDDALRRLNELATRRDELAVDAELAGAVVSLVSPAQEAESTGTGLQRTLPVSLLLGLVTAGAIAYLLAVRTRSFENRSQPEDVLGAPLLASVPDFNEERLATPIPVFTDPASFSAEAFRFVMSALDARVGELASTEDRDYGGHIVTMISARLGEGKTTVVANTALAAAQKGARVLVIDADLGSQQLSSILQPKASNPVGLTDVVNGSASLEQAVQPVHAGGRATLSLLSRGSASITAPDFFGAPATWAFIRKLPELYDLVIIDAPPLLQVAYASTLVRNADQTVVVVPHGGPVPLLSEVRERLELIGTPVAGYVYNRGPLRRDLAGTGGSVADILGARGNLPPA